MLLSLSPAMNSSGILNAILCDRLLLFLPFEVVKCEIEDKDDTENATDCFHEFAKEIRMRDLRLERIILIDTLNNNFCFETMVNA